MFEGENVVVRVNREERMRTEKELSGLIALGDADRKLKAEERQIDDPRLERSKLQAVGA